MEEDKKEIVIEEDASNIDFNTPWIIVDEQGTEEIPSISESF